MARASSSNDGFFQTVPTIPNQFHDDPIFQRSLKFFLPTNLRKEISLDLSRFGKEITSKEILDWVTDAEKNVPYLRGGGRDAFGKRTSELVVSEGWKRLQSYGIEQGIVASGYENRYAEYSRVVQFLKLQLWTGSNANVACPSAMSDGAAKLLDTHLSSGNLDSTTREVLQEAYNRLTSRKVGFAWTSGQWMTERTGGSDVSRTETIATYSPSENRLSDSPTGPWRLDGFKWFSSATDSSMTILLAQTQKGLSAFYAPMYQTSSSSESEEKKLNGVYISRLKNKFGTKSLPTAELELSGMRGFLLGKEGQGIKEISTILNITRLYSAVSAVGYLGRGLAIARAFARVREIGAGKGRRIMLKDSPLHMSTLAKITGEYHSMMLFTFFVSYLMGLDEHLTPQNSGTADPSSISQLKPEKVEDVPVLLRVLTPILKASVCKRSIHALQECMEALGGVGYLDNSEDEAINISRLYRDCCVLSIWEGTTDVLASDMLRVLKGRNGQEAIDVLDHCIMNALAGCRGVSTQNHYREDLIRSWASIKKEVAENNAEKLLPSARELLFKIADVLMGTLLSIDAESDQDLGAIGVCSRYLEHFHSPHSNANGQENTLALNQKIVYGNQHLEISTTSSKL